MFRSYLQIRISTYFTFDMRSRTRSHVAAFVRTHAGQLASEPFYRASAISSVPFDTPLSPPRLHLLRAVQASTPFLRLHYSSRSLTLTWNFQVDQSSTDLSLFNFASSMSIFSLLFIKHLLKHEYMSAGRLYRVYAHLLCRNVRKCKKKRNANIYHIWPGPITC